VFDRRACLLYLLYDVLQELSLYSHSFSEKMNCLLSVFSKISGPSILRHTLVLLT
jgi:hypothetical protein